MLEYLQDHQKLATVISVTAAAAVVVFLVLISGGNTPPSTGTSGYQSVVAHGQDGPVIPSSQGGTADTGTVDGSQGIRQADLPGLVGEETAGSWKIENTMFIDIDGDGSEEAIVLVRGEGENTPLDWRIYGMKNGEATLLFERTRVAQGELAVQGPMLVETEGVYSDGDAACCPSSTKHTYYVWKGGSLVVSRVEAAPPLTAAP